MERLGSRYGRLERLLNGGQKARSRIEEARSFAADEFVKLSELPAQFGQ